MVQQSVIDSVIVTEAEIKAEIEMRINYMMSQVGGKENFEQNIGKKPAEVRKFLYDPIRENLIAGRMKREILKNFKMTPQDVYDYYKKNEFNLPIIEEQVQLSQLIIQPEISKELEQKLLNELNELRLDIQSGKISMALAAALHSDDPGSQGRGGVLGLQSRENFVPEFSAVAYKISLKVVDTFD